MDALPPAHGALERDRAGSPDTPTDRAVFSALLHGLSDADASFVSGAIRRAQQATREADERGEASSQPIW